MLEILDGSDSPTKFAIEKGPYIRQLQFYDINVKVGKQLVKLISKLCELRFKFVDKFKNRVMLIKLL